MKDSAVALIVNASRFITEDAPQEAALSGDPDPLLIGRSPLMVELRRQLDRIANSSATVLVTGDTGTGKELVARYLHAHGARRDRAFIALNCAALPESLIESELFGHARGAFTGASTGYKGKIQLAARGTLFLDEIGDMSLTAQARLLRFLESGEIFPVGGMRAERVDVRIVAATNQDLAERVRQGLFRKDMYYRLNISRIEMPPLCQRREDIDELVAHFLRSLEVRYRRRLRGVSPPLRKLLMQYSWPGNVRELKNVLESAALQSDDETLEVHHLPLYFTAQVRTPEPLTEREMLCRALEQTHWNKSAAAQHLNWSRMTLYRKLAKYDLQDRPGLRPQ
jgi:DNA-binding NtrC family response regulator